MSRILFNVYKTTQPNKAHQGCSHLHSAYDTSHPFLCSSFLHPTLSFSFSSLLSLSPNDHNLMRKSLQESECYSLCGIMAQASLGSNCHIKQKIILMIFKIKRPASYSNYLKNGCGTTSIKCQTFYYIKFVY